MKSRGSQYSLDTSTFLRIRKWYVLALAAIALTIIIAQILIQQHLNSQLDDSRVINVAGRQRAFSQKLVKESLLLNLKNKDSDSHKELLKELKHTLWVWEISHHGLQHGNDSLGLSVETDTEILQLFKELTPHHDAMVMAAQTIIDLDFSSTSMSEYGGQLDILLNNERPFLQKMDAIVNEYDERSKAQLQKLKLSENRITGSMPTSVCQLRQNQPDQFVTLEADCQKIQCDCCTNCR